MILLSKDLFSRSTAARSRATFRRHATSQDKRDYARSPFQLIASATSRPRSCNLRDFPFVEIKVEPELVAGCAHDRAKRTLCRHVIDTANQLGARTVAVGIENYADFCTARALGFDLVQGFLFAKPMGVQTFMRAIGPDPATVV